MAFFFFNDTATTEIYTLSLHDALPILRLGEHADPLRLDVHRVDLLQPIAHGGEHRPAPRLGDPKSTRLNSSHGYISYAVFCFKKKTSSKHPASWSHNSFNAAHFSP